VPDPVTATTSVGFNITIGLGSQGKQVTIYAQDLADIATKGLYFSLPPATIIEMGTLADLITWLNTQLTAAGVTLAIPTTAGSGWPQAIADIYNGILNTVVSVDTFSLAQDPQVGGVYPPLRFDLEVTGIAMDTSVSPPVPKPIPILGNLFSVVGGGIGLIRTYPGAPALPAGNGSTPAITPGG
jgi:hypothetical protein